MRLLQIMFFSSPVVIFARGKLLVIYLGKLHSLLGEATCLIFLFIACMPGIFQTKSQQFCLLCLGFRGAAGSMVLSLGEISGNSLKPQCARTLC